MDMVNHAVHYELFSGKTGQIILEYVNKDDAGLTHCQKSFQEGGYLFNIKDSYKNQGENKVTLQRKIVGTCLSNPSNTNDGIRFWCTYNIESSLNDTWRFCLPSIHYTKPSYINKAKTICFMEDRLTACFVAAYNATKGQAYVLTRKDAAKKTEVPLRKKGDSRYLHKTEVGSLGYSLDGKGNIKILSCWPYYEGDESVALSSYKTPVYSFYPLDGSDIDIVLEYDLEVSKTDSFTDSIYNPFRNLAYYLDRASNKVINLPFTLEDSINYRIESLGKSYREFDNDGAGFFFHFDPTKGYGSAPSGFGTSFNTIPHDSYIHILEYGFTGRQINAALIMAKLRGGVWSFKGKKVIDFFLNNCMTENGWLYTLYDLKTKAPFYSFGDPEAPKLHYISRTADKGNYLRTMTEAMNDVLEAYIWYKENGEERKDWLSSVRLFANFLVNHQNSDGSWYRAYKADGSPASIGTDTDINETELIKGNKSASAIPLIFLCNLCKALTDQGEDIQRFYNAALRCGKYILDNSVREEHYQGGTLDNPNVVDKEASQYTMAGLYHLYKLTGDDSYLIGAVKAVRMFVTWNYIWNAPTQPGTYLHEKNFATKGYGGINSIWGGGVVDIYSLFHIMELYLIGREINDEFLCLMADWIGTGTQQILSYPGDDMNFKDIGMQPEGFGICNQGIDDGMISKGDIWGTLGWIYSAGIYGLSRYIEV